MSSERAGQPWRDPGAPPGQRAEVLAAVMSFEEKVAIALGEFETVAHLGVPSLKYTDGPNGIRGPDTVTAFPASLALAATFDDQLAAAYGGAVAEEARDTGSNVLLGPAVDIARTPLGGRLLESMGEDPYLAGGWPRPRYAPSSNATSSQWSSTPSACAEGIDRGHGRGHERRRAGSQRRGSALRRSSGGSRTASTAARVQQGTPGERR
jgi:hypothetical protein